MAERAGHSLPSWPSSKMLASPANVPSPLQDLRMLALQLRASAPTDPTKGGRRGCALRSPRTSQTRSRVNAIGFALCFVGGHAVPAAQQGSLELLATGLDFPANVAVAPDQDGRIFIVDYYVGKIFVIEDGELQSEPFLDIQDKLEAEREITSGETGLISLAFPPDFSTSGQVYVTYTGQRNKLLLSRFAVNEKGTQAIRSSERVIMSAENWGGRHHCGHLEFGPDNLLYMCIGDAGRDYVAQDLSVINGAIIRIDVEDGSGDYAVPVDNPFVDVAGARPEIWIYGVRNPWRFIFDGADGTLYVPDVGRKRWEELNVVPKSAARGSNLGWGLAEGNECLGQCSADELVWPSYTYRYGEDGCSIIGGAVYRGEKYRKWNGVYVFSDFCTGDVWGLRDIREQPKVRKLIHNGGSGDPRDGTISDFSGPTAMGVGPDGEILVTSGPGGSLYRLHFPSDFVAGWQDLRELQLAELLVVERTGSGWANKRLRDIMKSRRWRWTQPLVDLYSKLREVFD